MTKKQRQMSDLYAITLDTDKKKSDICELLPVLSTKEV